MKPSNETVPPWADSAGRDAYGRWAQVTLAGVAFKLRWIPPGEFIMGSPPNEPGRILYDGEHWTIGPDLEPIKEPLRFDQEGPQHRVALTTGFWLGETPVVQALWEAVIGHNPSYFRSPTRPVELVNFHQVQAFFAACEQLRPGLKLGLPSDAEWEYACRAGTTTATYAGPLNILGENNAPVADQVGWYGGNCGVDFELDVGQDGKLWREKQYDFLRGGSHPVGLKLVNPWGLYDMLGNVWEWCRDAFRTFDIDRTASPDEDWMARVVRGGSWNDGARYLRAATRFGSRPGDACNHTGFRLYRADA